MAKRILVVDDDADFVEAVSIMLEAKGYDVISAPDGKDGFKKAKADVPDLILLDVMMTSKTEGFDMSRDLKSDESTKDIPVVMVTGIRKEMDLPFGFQPDDTWLPVATVLEKPIKLELLLKTVEENIKQ